MKYLMFAAVGITLSTAGVTVFDWQLYVILTAMTVAFEYARS